MRPRRNRHDYQPLIGSLYNGFQAFKGLGTMAPTYSKALFFACADSISPPLLAPCGKTQNSIDQLFRFNSQKLADSLEDGEVDVREVP
jgi:hypothetical protein